jgi:hypothetical protein
MLFVFSSSLFEDYFPLIISNLLVILFFLFFQNNKKKTDTVYQNHIARLEARSLRAQMNPHFIYNALNSLQSVMLLKGERETNRYIGMLSKQFPENDLSMTRAITQYQTTQLAERQIDMLNYAHRILQKEEAINATLNATTPTVTVTNTITSTSSPASEANQLAILNVLKRILTKITSNREALNR